MLVSVDSYSSSSGVSAYTTNSGASNKVSGSGSSGSSKPASNTTNTTPAAEYTPSGATSASATYSKPTVRCGIASSSGSSSSTGASSSSTGVSSSSTGGASSSTGSSSVSDASSPGTYNAAAHSGKSCDETDKEKNQNTNNGNTTNSSASVDNNNSNAAATTNQNNQTNIYTEQQIDDQAKKMYDGLIAELNGATGQEAVEFFTHKLNYISEQIDDYNDILGKSALPKVKAWVEDYLTSQASSPVAPTPTTPTTPTAPSATITEKTTAKIPIETLDDYNKNEVAQNELISAAKTEFENAQNSGNETDMQIARNQANQARLNGGTIANDNDYKSIIDGQISIFNDTKQKYSSAKSSNDTTKMNNLYAVEIKIRDYLMTVGKTDVSTDDDPNNNPTTRAESLFQSMIKYMKDNNISGDSARIYTTSRMKEYENDVSTNHDQVGPAVVDLVNDMLIHFDFTKMKPIDSTDSTDKTNDVKPVKVKAVISKDVQDSIANTILSNMSDEIDGEASYLASESININNDDFSQDDYNTEYQESKDYLAEDISDELDDMWDSICQNINYINDDGTTFSGNNFVVQNDIKNEITAHLSDKVFDSLDSSINEMADNYSGLIDTSASDDDNENEIDYINYEDIADIDNNSDNIIGASNDNYYDMFSSTITEVSSNYSTSPTTGVMSNNTAIVTPSNYSTSPATGVMSNNTAVVTPSNYSTSPATGIMFNSSTTIATSSNNNDKGTIGVSKSFNTMEATGMTTKEIKQKPSASTKVDLYGYSGKNRITGHEKENATIKNIKNMLNYLGYTKVKLDGSKNGEFGIETYTAVKTFQQDYMGLKNPSGVVGPLTLKSLKACVALKASGVNVKLDKKKPLSMLEEVCAGIAQGAKTVAVQMAKSMVNHPVETFLAIAMMSNPAVQAAFVVITGANCIQDVINAVHAPTAKQKASYFTQGIINGIFAATGAKAYSKSVDALLDKIDFSALKSIVQNLRTVKPKFAFSNGMIDSIDSVPISKFAKNVQNSRSVEGNITNKDNIVPEGAGNSILKAGDKTPNGYVLTKHAAEHANERGFSLTDIDDVISSYSKKYYSYGEEIYCKKINNYYKVVIKSRSDDNIVSVIGGKTHSMKTITDVEQFLKRSGRTITTIPLN